MNELGLWKFIEAKVPIGKDIPTWKISIKNKSFLHWLEFRPVSPVPITYMYHSHEEGHLRLYFISSKSFSFFLDIPFQGIPMKSVSYRHLLPHR